MSASAVRTLMVAASGLVESGDYAGAKVKALAAKALLAGMPDGGKGSVNLTWDRVSIDAFIAEMESEISSSVVASAGIRRSKVRYVNPGVE